MLLWVDVAEVEASALIEGDTDAESEAVCDPVGDCEDVAEVEGVVLGVAVLLDDDVGVTVSLRDAVLDGVWLDDCEAVLEAVGDAEFEGVGVVDAVSLAVTLAVHDDVGDVEAVHVGVAVADGDCEGVGDGVGVTSMQESRCGWSTYPGIHSQVQSLPPIDPSPV